MVGMAHTSWEPKITTAKGISIIHLRLSFDKQISQRTTMSYSYCTNIE